MRATVSILRRKGRPLKRPHRVVGDICSSDGRQLTVFDDANSCQGILDDARMVVIGATGLRFVGNEILTLSDNGPRYYQEWWVVLAAVVKHNVDGGDAPNVPVVVPSPKATGNAQ